MRFSWRAALAFGVSAVFLYVALKGVDWTHVGSAVRESNPALWIAAVAISQTTFVLRAMRWRVILAPVAPHLAYGPAWRATAIGMMVNNIIPARVGELARAYVLAREEPRIPFPTALASLVVDRTLDSLVVLVLLLVAVLDPAFGTQMDVNGRSLGAWVTLGSILVAGAFAVLALAVFAPAATEGIVGAVIGKLAPRFAGRARGLVRAVTSGLHVLRDVRKLLTALGWTFAHWIVNALAFWVGFKALGIAVPLTAALLVQGLIVVLVALPQAPGFFGTFEFAAKVALALYAVGEDHAISWALTYHILSFLPITVVGIYYVTRMGLSLGDLRRMPGAPAAS